MLGFEVIEFAAADAVLARAGASLLASVQDRIELLSVELQEEKYRLIQTFVWVSAAIFTAGLAIAFASLAVVYYFWENARVAALGGLALFYTGVFAGVVYGFRRYLARQPRPFAATLEELREDRACIRDEN